jgi:hypothetical protein
LLPTAEDLGKQLAEDRKRSAMVLTLTFKKASMSDNVRREAIVHIRLSPEYHANMETLRQLLAIEHTINGLPSDTRLHIELTEVQS